MNIANVLDGLPLYRRIVHKTKKTCKTIVQQVQFPLGCLNPKVESLCKLLSNN